MAYQMGNARAVAAAALLLGSSAALAQMQAAGQADGASIEAAAPTEPVTAAPVETQVATPAPDTPAPATYVFDSQVAFSPTYSSGYYYASPYSGYTSLSYYGSIYTARRFGG